MGTHTNGIVFFGYVWDEEYDDWFGDLDELRENAAEAGADFGCKLDTHCSGEVPMLYVCVEASETVAYRGRPERLNANMSIDPQWIAKLQQFLRALGIDPPLNNQVASWWLVSDWT